MSLYWQHHDIRFGDGAKNLHAVDQDIHYDSGQRLNRILSGTTELAPT
jgi:hypothetical protein